MEGLECIPDDVSGQDSGPDAGAPLSSEQVFPAEQAVSPIQSAESPKRPSSAGLGLKIAGLAAVAGAALFGGREISKELDTLENEKRMALAYKADIEKDEKTGRITLPGRYHYFINTKGERCRFAVRSGQKPVAEIAPPEAPAPEVAIPAEEEKPAKPRSGRATLVYKDGKPALLDDDGLVMTQDAEGKTVETQVSGEEARRLKKDYGEAGKKPEKKKAWVNISVDTEKIRRSVGAAEQKGKEMLDAAGKEGKKALDAAEKKGREALEKAAPAYEEAKEMGGKLMKETEKEAKNLWDKGADYLKKKIGR